jgi:hypothetical protein
MLSKHDFRWLYTSDFIRTIDYYAKSLSEKILPSFKDDEISEEANKIEEETYNRLGSFQDPEWYDPAADIDQARDAGVAFYMMAEGIKQGMINMFTAGLHHLFEQQLIQFHRHQLLWEFRWPVYDLPTMEKKELKKIEKLLSVKKAQERLLKGYNIDISAFACWDKLEELRLVANTVKHADGESCTLLRKIRPDLFIHPDINGPSHFRLTDAMYLPVYQPLAGEGMYIPLEEFNKYVEATKRFWEELAQAVDALPEYTVED